MTMEEFNLASSRILNYAKEEPHEHLWMCNASKASMEINSSKWCKDTMDNTYVLIPYPKEEFELAE